MSESEIRHRIWQELQRAVPDRHHEWRTPVLASADADGLPDARTVVLRQVDALAGQLTFYTDSRSPKVPQLQAQAQAMLVFWSARLGWQLRVRVVCTVITAGPEVETLWQVIKQSAAAGDAVTVTPDGKLQLLAAAAFHDKTRQAYQSYLWHSTDGKTWPEPQAVGEAEYWVWRLSWLRDQAYAVAYKCGSDRHIRLYQQKASTQFEVIAPRIYAEGYANEAALLFDNQDTAWCLLRKDPDHGQLGHSLPPYTHWQWLDIGCRIGGPQAIVTADGKMLAVVRLYNETVRTSLVTLDQSTGELTEIMALPSGGDTSYAGMVLQQNKLLISYYSSHQGRSSIYTALLRIQA